MVERTDSPDSKTSPNIVIIGQGAIGLLWYANFYLNNVTANNNNTGNNNKTSHLNISLLSSNDAFKTLRSFDYKSYDGTANEIPLRHASTAHLSSADIILLCVKSYQVASAYQQYQLEQLTKATIVFCHNGLGALEDLHSKGLSKHRNIAAVALTHGAKIAKNQATLPSITLTHTGEGFVDVGCLQGDFSQPAQQVLTQALSLSLTSTWRDDLTFRLWQKLAINCVINPLTAIHNINNGQVNSPQFYQQIDVILLEFITIAKSQSFNFNFSALKEVVIDVANKTAQNCSSMRADVLAGKRTEIDYINGYLARIAQEKDIDCRENEKLVAAVSAGKHL